MRSPASVDELLEQARARLDRLTPPEAHAAQVAGALVVDIRPVVHRIEEGEIEGGIVIERNVLEWRLDPNGPDRIPELVGADQTVILVCNEGYASSLAAASLRSLGLTRTTDVIGGYRAWRAAGLPTATPPDPTRTR